MAYDFYTVQCAYLEEGCWDGCIHTVINSIHRTEEEARAYVEAHAEDEEFEKCVIIGGYFGKEVNLEWG